jgi:hypothetical protein
MLNRSLPALLAALCLTVPAFAQAEPTPEPALSLELNDLSPTDAGCRATFVAANTLDADIDRTALEMALFDRDGIIERIVMLEFADLTRGRTKVLQFVLDGLDCADLGRVLVNAASACEGPAERSACLDALVTSARPDVVFGI